MSVKYYSETMRDCGLMPPPTPVCLKGPANIEKCTHKYFSNFYCILFLINILDILAYVKRKINKYTYNHIIY
jgi:hypothetical protein